MKTIKTLTVAGETYALGHLDETKVADGSWSAKKLIDTLCPGFAVTGKAVVCYPVEGYPLEVVSTILPRQEGTPAFDNPCPILGTDRLTLTHNGEAIAVSLGETIYGGTYNWQTGELTLTHGFYAMTGQERYSIYDKIFLAYRSVAFGNSGISDGICSHGPYEGYKSGSWCANGTAVVYTPDGDYPVDESGLQAFRDDVIAQYENGTPVQLCYKLAAPITVQAEPQAVFAKAGENVFSSQEEITIRGRWDLKKLLEGVVQ